MSISKSIYWLLVIVALSLNACGTSDGDGDDGGATAQATQCNDGIDNDGDGKIDFGSDPGCISTSDDDETDPATTPQCSDGIDNDNDGLTDYGNDPGCISAADDDEIDPATGGHNSARANSYDDAWQVDWINNVETILATDVGITKTAGKVLQVGDSMTHSFAYGLWARNKNGATASETVVIDWMHAGTSGNINGWDLSSGGITAEGGMTWDNAKVDNIFTDPTINDAQFAVIMMNVHDINYVGQRIDQFIAAGIVPIISTIPPRDHPTYNDTHAQPYNAEVRALAQQKKIPLIDYWEEILLRRPGTTWINTIIGPDGVHPSGSEYVDPSSDPYASGGDASTHTTGDAPLYSGYLLRTWLTVQKLKEIKQNAVD